VVVSLALGFVILVARLSHNIAVPGYAATALLVVFFGGLNALGLGVVGSYAWRAYENSKGRPLAIVMSEQAFDGMALDSWRTGGQQDATELMGNTVRRLRGD
jgi:hypothetical protein